MSLTTNHGLTVEQVDEILAELSGRKESCQKWQDREKDINKKVLWECNINVFDETIFLINQKLAENKEHKNATD